jgi:hypothetical protein
MLINCHLRSDRLVLKCDQSVEIQCVANILILTIYVSNVKRQGA